VFRVRLVFVVENRFGGCWVLRLLFGRRGLVFGCLQWLCLGWIV